MKLEFQILAPRFSRITRSGSYTHLRPGYIAVAGFLLAAVSIETLTTASAAVPTPPTITAQYLLNFYDYQEPGSIYTNSSSTTLAQGVGGGFLPSPFPSTWGSTPAFVQAQAFGNATTITAQQNGVILNPAYENFPGAPWEHSAEIACNVVTGCNPALNGSWNVTINNPGFVSPQVPAGSVGPGTPPRTIPSEIVPAYPTANLQTYAIPSDIPQEIPFVRNVQVSNSTPNATLSWTQPTFSIPSGAIRQTVLLISSNATKQVMGDFVLPTGQTSFDLSQLGTILSDGVPTQPLQPGSTYQFSVQTTLLSSTPNVFEIYSTARSFTNFKPTNASPPFVGSIYVPNVSQTVGGGITYQFALDVQSGATYNIDPAMAHGFIYDTSAGDPNFATVELPNIGNLGDYSLYLWESGKWVFDANLGPDSVFNFGPGGVNEFEVLGINPGVDPSNGNEFVTQVSFVGTGTFNGSMTPVTSGVPEPSTWAMMLIGFVGLGFAARKGMASASGA